MKRNASLAEEDVLLFVTISTIPDNELNARQYTGNLHESIFIYMDMYIVRVCWDQIFG